MVYCDNYMTVVIADIAEIGHNGQDSLYITHHSGTRNQTRYQNPQELLQAYTLISRMIVQLNTGKSMEEHTAEGTTVTVETGGDGPQGLSLVDENSPE